MQLKRPVLLWLIILAYGVSGLWALSDVAGLFSALEIPDRRYPVLLSNELAFSLVCIGLVGGLISKLGVAICGYLLKPQVVHMAIAYLLFTLCLFLASLESVGWGAALPEFMIATYFVLWAAPLVLGTLALIYLYKLRTSGVFQ